MSLTDQFAELPPAIRNHLIRIARCAAGMSTDEKEAARLYLGGYLLQMATTVSDESLQSILPVVTLVSEAARVVVATDEASGDAASWLVM